MDFFDSKRILFDTWSNWSRYTLNAVTWLLKAIFGVVYAIVMGLVSLLREIGLFYMRVIRKWPLTSFAVWTVVLVWIFLLAFTKVSYQAKTYEHQRDSIAYDFDVMKESLGIDSLGIKKYFNNDTVIIYDYHN